MWLTWFQVVDHVWYFQSNIAKGMCSIDDSLNPKVSLFFDTPFPSSWTRNPHHPSNMFINPSPKIHLRSIYPHTGYAKITLAKYDATSSYHTTLDPLDLPVICISYIYQYRFCLSTWWHEDSSSESSTPCKIPPYEPIQSRICWAREANFKRL